MSLTRLSRFFIGDFISGTGLISNTYWKGIEVEDTASGIFKTKDGKTATIFCSWRLLWIFHFSVEWIGEGYINVDA